MKNLIYIFVAAGLLNMQSCGKIELLDEGADSEHSGNSSGNNGGQGTTPEGVVSVQQLSSVSKGTEVTVAGYIVGFVRSRTISNTVFGVEDAVASNLVIADSPSETDPKKCAPVELKANTDERYELNLADNPHLLGTYVHLTGICDKYYYTVGIRPLFFYEFAEPGDNQEDNPPVPLPQVYPLLSHDNPQVFEGC